jgi:hypothetical protein
MTDMQLISFGLPLLAIFAAMHGNRKSVEDMRDVLRAEWKSEIAEMRAGSKSEMAELRAGSKSEMAELRAEMAEMRTEMRRGFESLEMKLLVHELEHHRK